MEASMLQLMSRDGRGWFLGSILAACLLEGVGFISLALHQQSLTNHLAFFISFSTTLIAPFVIIMANTACFIRLVSRSSTHESFPRFRNMSHLVNGVNCVVVLLLSFSIYNIGLYLSPRPIDGMEGAMERLSYYERATSLLAVGHIIAFFALALFGGVVAAFTRQQYKSKTATEKSVLFAVNAINTLSLMRIAWKTAQYVMPTSDIVPLADSGLSFWLCDALPILLASMLLCAIIPGFASIRRPSTSLVFGRLQQARHVSEKQSLLITITEEDDM